MATTSPGFLFPFGDFAADQLRTSNGVSGSGAGNLVDNSGIAWATLYSGAYKIAGVATLNGDPVSSRRIFLTPHNLAIFVGGAYSAADGTFLFDGLAAGKYTIYGVDQDGTTNGVIWDYVDAVPR